MKHYHYVTPVVQTNDMENYLAIFSLDTLYQMERDIVQLIVAETLESQLLFYNSRMCEIGEAIKEKHEAREAYGRTI